MKAPVRDSAVPLPPLFDSACAMVCRNCCSRAAMSVAGASEGVCGFKASKSLVWKSAGGLMDEALDPQARAEIDTVLAGFAHPTIRFDHVSSRRAGQRRFVDLHMHMPAAWTLGRAAAVRTSVEQALMSAVPGLRASIQLLPLDVEAHFGDPKDLI